MDRAAILILTPRRRAIIELPFNETVVVYECMAIDDYSADGRSHGVKAPIASVGALDSHAANQPRVRIPFDHSLSLFQVGNRAVSQQKSMRDAVTFGGIG